MNERNVHVVAEDVGLESDAIAVIGIDVKLPGDAVNAEAFFELLLNGRSARCEVPKDRYNIDAFYHPDPARGGTVGFRHGHFLKDDIAAFDAPFFSISPADAACMDPQQRILLESVYRALENAGISTKKVSGSDAAVYMGCFTRDYEDLSNKDPESGSKHSGVGSAQTMIANRVSWFYDFRGPSVTLDTACSGSLVACHLACKALKAGDTSLAIVGGCNLLITPESSIYMTKTGMFSPDGKCYSFDHRANGYSRGEGAGIVVLKRLSDAIRDEDTIRAVIRNTVTNSDGRSPSITAPTKWAQAEAIRKAYKQSGLDPRITRYFEAHATGTPVGDPIEASAIADVFAELRSPDEPIYIGAVKSNIGHLEASSGIAALIKSILILETGLIPPNLNFEKTNPRIPATQWNMKFPLSVTPWPSSGVRRASINSFGIGGSNAHIVLDDAFHYLKIRGITGNHRTTENLQSGSINGASNGDQNGTINGGNHGTLNGHTNGTVNGGRNGTLNGHVHDTNMENKINGLVSPWSKSNRDGPREGPSPLSKSRVFVFSAFDEAGLGRLLAAYHQHLLHKSTSSFDEEPYLDDLSYTLAVKRTIFNWRASVIASSVSSLLTGLGDHPNYIRANPQPRLAFVFTGQGAQWAAMGRELLVYPVFKDSILAALVYLQELGCTWSLLHELLKDGSTSSINDPEFSQPICTVLQVALVELLYSWDARPVAVVGHSSGEIAAAFAVGAISRTTAWRLAYHRGHLSASLSFSAGQVEGGMIAVALGATEAVSQINKLGLSKSLTIACINSPSNVTISGSAEDISCLKVVLDATGIFARKLQVKNAYHSSFMLPIAEEYRRLIGSLQSGNWKGQAVPVFYSSLTGQRADFEQLLSPEYWINNLVSPVKFSDAVTRMLVDAKPKARKLRQAASYPISELLEIGPHAALGGPIREIMEQVSDSDATTYASVLRRGVSAIKTIFDTLSWLYCRGHPIDIMAMGRPRDLERPVRLLLDLPSYTFDHSKTYWHESRISKGYRFRRFARHELLGAPAADWDPSNAVWRNWLRISENQWIADHRVAGALLYPAAGMIVMAIEACRQLAILHSERVVKAFVLKEVSILTALVVPEASEGIETHFHVRPHHDSTSSATSSMQEFELQSCVDGIWSTHCRGLIRTEYETVYSVVDNGLEEREFIKDCADRITTAETGCDIKIPPSQCYAILSTLGFNFGPNFQRLSDIRVGQSQNAIATISAARPSDHDHSHLIHPTTLDGVFQAVLVAANEGGRKVCDIHVPTFFKEIWVAADAIQISHRAVACETQLGLRQKEASIVSVDPVSKKPLVVIDGFVLTALAQGHALDSEELQRSLCFNVDWKPEPDFMTQDNVDISLPLQTDIFHQDIVDKHAIVKRLCLVYVCRYLKSYDPIDGASRKPHYGKYITWAQHLRQQYESGKMGQIAGLDRLIEDDGHLLSYEAEVEHSSAEATMTIAIGRKLKEILDEDLDPLSILFSGQIAENVYRSGMAIEATNRNLSRYIDALVHKNPGMDFLEIGAGTGGATRPILDTMASHGENEAGAYRFNSYDFTDISSSFFGKAKESFKFATPRMNFRVLNIEKDPIEQGFQAGHYDVIVASNVLHATASIDRTLRNARKLLKPGGKLVLFEITNPESMSGFAFGLLEGWWLCEEAHRQHGPLMTVPTWSEHLERSGFSGVDLCLDHSPEDPKNNLASIMISSAVEEQQKMRPLRVVVCTYQDSVLQKAVADDLQIAISRIESADCCVIPLGQLKSVDLERKACIFLPDLDSSLQDVTEDGFAIIKIIISSAGSILWLTRGGPNDLKKPDSEVVTGLARTVRSEKPKLKFVTLSLDMIKDPSPKTLCATTMKVFEAAFVDPQKRVVDNTFTEASGVISIPRLVEANNMNKAVSQKVKTQYEAEPQLFGADPTRALRLKIGAVGLLDTLHFDDDAQFDEPLTDGQVEFKVMACGLNFFDVLTALGQISHGTQIGLDGVGVVTRTGHGSDLKSGDRVCGVSKAGIATFARGTNFSLSKIPDHLSFVSAASIPTVFTTAYAALYDIANIAQGETVLIHAAAGGVGQACIQLAQLRGAEIFATVGSLPKVELIEQFGIARDHIFSSRDLTFAKGVMRMTRGRGVDVVVNSLSGPALRASWDCIAACGRFIEIGKVDIYSSARLNMSKFRYNVSFDFVDVSYMAQEDGPRFKRLLDSVLQLVEDRKIVELKPVRVFGFDKVQEAFRYMQGGTHTGKIVLEPHEDDEVMVLPSSKPKYSFEANVTYLISGGLGGLGRSIARWLVRRGARNLILLSRRGAIQDSGKALVKELELAGVSVATPPCNVSDLQALREMLDNCAKTMPPIRGCIQASMVLKDGLFSNMTHADFTAALAPKVAGSWNLHSLLPTTLDFFILLASGSGIVGNPGQANYAAGNTYQDALARYRTANGLKATSLDLGMILSVGFVAENPELMTKLRSRGIPAIREEEFLAILDEICDPHLEVSTQLKSQICLGVEIPEVLRSKGMEVPQAMQDPLFRHLFQIRSNNKDGAETERIDSVDFKTLLAGLDTRKAAEEACICSLSDILDSVGCF